MGVHKSCKKWHASCLQKKIRKHEFYVKTRATSTKLAAPNNLKPSTERADWLKFWLSVSKLKLAVFGEVFFSSIVAYYYTRVNMYMYYEEKRVEQFVFFLYTPRRKFVRLERTKTWAVKPVTNLLVSGSSCNFSTMSFEIVEINVDHDRNNLKIRFQSLVTVKY